MDGHESLPVPAESRDVVPSDPVLEVKSLGVV